MPKIKYDIQNDIQKVLIVIANEMKKPTRFYIPKGLVTIKSNLPQNRFYRVMSYILSETVGIETKHSFVVLHQETFMKYLEETYPQIHKVITDGT